MKPKEQIIFLGTVVLLGGILTILSAFISWAPDGGSGFYASRVYFLPVLGLLGLLAGIGCVAGRAGTVTGVVLVGLGIIVLLLSIALSSQLEQSPDRPGLRVGFWLAIIGSLASALSGYLVLKISRSGSSGHG